MELKIITVEFVVRGFLLGSEYEISPTNSYVEHLVPVNSVILGGSVNTAGGISWKKWITECES